MYKASSIITCCFLIFGLFIQPSAFSEKMEDERKVILFLGDSLTAGYGVEEKHSYPGRIQHRIETKGLNYRVINAGISGDTSSGALRRIDWLLSNPIDIFVLAIGTNDGLRGIPMESTENNLVKIIDKVKAKNPKVKILIAGMLIPPSMGKVYGDAFKEVFPRVAKKKNTKLIKFLLEGVAGESSLNLPDGIHPNVKGYEIVVENVWAELEPMLNKS